MHALVHGILQRTQDSKGAEYLAVVLDGNQAPLDACWLHLRKEGLHDAVAARHARDGVENAHVTVATVTEWGGLTKYKPDLLARAEELVGQRVALDLHGIGKALSPKTGGNAWFGVVSCAVLEQFREHLEMRPKDFHVTLAFSPKDVFDASKGMDSLVVPWAQLLSPPLDATSGPSAC